MRAFRTVVAVDQQISNGVANGEHTLVARWDPHDNNILRVLLVIVGCDQVHNLIVYDAGIRVIDSTVTADQELRRLFLSPAGRLQEFAKARVGVDDVGNTFGRIEPRDLDDVVADRPLELVRLLFNAQTAELAHVVLRVPWAEVLIQSIEPEPQARGVNEDSRRDGRSTTYQSVAAPRRVNFSEGTSLGTNLLTG